MNTNLNTSYVFKPIEKTFEGDVPEDGVEKDLRRIFKYEGMTYIEAYSENETIDAKVIYCDEFLKNYDGDKKVSFYIDENGVVSLTKPDGNYYAVINQIEFRLFEIGKHFIEYGKLFTENIIQLDDDMKLKDLDTEISRKMINVKSGKVLIGIKDGVSMFDDLIKNLVELAPDENPIELAVSEMNDTKDEFLKLSYMYTDINEFPDKDYIKSTDVEAHIKGIATAQREFFYWESECYLLPRVNPFTEYLKTPSILIPFINPEDKQPVVYLNNKLLFINPRIIKKGSQSYILISLDSVYKFPIDDMNEMWRNIMLWYEENKMSNTYNIVLRDKFKFVETSIIKNKTHIPLSEEVLNASYKEVYIDGYLLDTSDYSFDSTGINIIIETEGKELLTITFNDKHTSYTIPGNQVINEILYNDFFYKEFFIDGYRIYKEDMLSITSNIHINSINTTHDIRVLDYREYNKDKYYRCHCGETLGKDNFDNNIICPKCGFPQDEFEIKEGILTDLVKNKFMDNIEEIRYLTQFTLAEGKSVGFLDHSEPKYKFINRVNATKVNHGIYEPNLSAGPAPCPTILNTLPKPELIYNYEEKLR